MKTEEIRSMARALEEMKKKKCDETSAKVSDGEVVVNKDKKNKGKKADVEIEVSEENLDELSKKTLGSYVKKASDDMYSAGTEAERADARANKARKSRTDTLGRSQTIKKYVKKSLDADKRAAKRNKGIERAVGKLTKEETLHEDYKDVENSYIDKIISVSDEINKLSKDIVSTHKSLKPGEYKGKLYEPKYIVRQLEDVRDSILRMQYNPANSKKMDTASVAEGTEKGKKDERLIGHEDGIKTPNERLKKQVANESRSNNANKMRDALREMAQRDQHTRGATPPEKMADKWSWGAKMFAAVHRVETPRDTDINAAIEDNEANMHNMVGKSPMRPNDNDIGDKATPKPNTK